MERKNILIALALIAAVGGGAAWYLYQKPAERSVSGEAEVVIGAKDLLAAFQTDEAKAMTTYAKSDQVIQVTGTVRAIDTSDPAKVNVILETGDALAGVTCEFEPAHAPQWAEGASVKVNGVCAGILMDVVLTRCAAVE